MIVKLLAWARRLPSLLQQARPRRRGRWAAHRLALESLEDRTAPAVLIWTGAGTDDNWGTAANWANGTGPAVPKAGDELVFGTSARHTSHNNLTGRVFKSITFQDSGYTITGNTISLSGGVRTTDTVNGTSTIQANLQLTRSQTFDIEGGDARVVLEGAVMGNAGLIKTGAGILAYAGARPNTYTGETVVNGGTLQFAKMEVPAIQRALIINSGTVEYDGHDHQVPDKVKVAIREFGVLDLNGQTDVIGGLNMRGGSVTTGEGLLKLAGNLVSLASAITASISGRLDMNGQVRSLVVANGSAADDLTISATIGNGGLAKAGPGRAVLSGANDYAKLTLVMRGTLVVENANALGSTGAGTIVSAGATLLINGDHRIGESLSLSGAGVGGVGALRLANGLSEVLGSVTLATAVTIGVDSTLSPASLLLSGPVRGTASLTKVGTGALTLSSANAFTGGTTVRGGSLGVTNTTGSATGSGTVTLGPGATLVGSGTVRNLLVTKGATLLPGEPVGPLYTGSLAFAAGATLGIDLDGTTPGSDLDQVVVRGTVNLGGATLVLTGLFSDGVKNHYTIIDNDGTDRVVNTFAGLPEGAIVQVSDPNHVKHSFRISYKGGTGNDVTLTRVSNRPPAVTDGAAALNEDGVLNGTLPVATDAEGDAVTYLSGTGPAHGTVVVNPDGTFTYIPHSNFNGTDHFTFKATDGVALSAAATFTVTVHPVNDPPVGTDGMVQTLEDTPYTFTVADFGFTDPLDAPYGGGGNQLMTVWIVTPPATGSLTISGMPLSAGQPIDRTALDLGLMKYVPPANANGPAYASFTFVLQDDGGTEDGGIDLDQSPNQIIIRLLPVNDPPVGSDNTVATPPGTAYTFTADDFGFSDPLDEASASGGNQLLAVVALTVPSAGTLLYNGEPVTPGQTVSREALDAGLLQFVPAGGTGAPYAELTFQVQDDGGTEDGGLDLDPIARTITINVTA